jgi:hypothetical protein
MARLAPGLFLVTSLLLNASDLHVRVGDVEDRRTTGKFFGGLEVELKLTGDILADVKSIRPVIQAAADDSGRSLLQEEKQTGFEDVSRGGSPMVKLKLRNPARKASMIKELKGELQLFVPQQDPKANVAVNDVASQSGKQIESPVLKAERIEVMPLTKADFDARKAKAAAQKKTSTTDAGLAGAFEQAFAGLFSGFMSTSENSVVLLVRDPGQKLVSVEWENSSGEKVRSRGRSSSKNENEETRVYDFEKRPDRLILQVLTAKALVSVPLNLTDIPLP